MASPPEGTSTEPLSAGWGLLAAGEWHAARETFEDLLTREETAEALEGLSWSAWWLDDADTVFQARERAYLLYRHQGDLASAARMATWLAGDQLDFRGALSVAGGWLRRARRLLESVAAAPDHGWLAFHEGYIALLSGDAIRAEELGLEAVAAGRDFGVPDLEMLGLALQGTVLVGRAEVEEGMSCLDEATASALAGEATIPISGAWACCFLVGSCTAVFDYERAFEWCDRIAEFAERYGSRYMLAFCRAEYGEIYLWRGRWADAEEMLEASIDDFSRSRPGMVAGPMVRLAELRRRQGRTDEAVQLLDRAGASTSARLCRARIALDRGEVSRAVELLERLLRQTSPEHELHRVPILELLVRARVARGDLDGAAAALDALRAIEVQVATEPLRATTDVVEGIVAAARRDTERAKELFEDAVDRFQRIGAPYEAARARVELALCLAALGRTEAAEREGVAAVDRLLELGADGEAARVRRLLGSDAGSRPAIPGVTPRESEVLELVAEGLTNRQIAERLVVSEHTIHRHVTNILRKLELPSRAAAAVYAVRTGALGDDPT